MMKTKDGKCFSSFEENQTKEDFYFSQEDLMKTKDGKCFSSFAETQTKEELHYSQEEISIKKEEKWFSSLQTYLYKNGVVVYQAIGASEVRVGSTLGQFKN